ncbi:MAG: hypothetical protein Q9169_007369 [Polycauliona sp. 2 TL-2023]
MPKIETLKSWLKEKLRKSDDTIQWSFPETNAKPNVMLDRQIHTSYLMNLMALYTDTNFEDVTATLNHIYHQEYTTQAVRACYAYNCHAEIPDLDHLDQQDLPDVPLDYNGQYSWFLYNFLGQETDKDYNKPILDLAKHRRDYDTAMNELGKSIPSDAPLLKDDRSEDIERLSKPSEHRLDITNFRDMRPSDLDKIFEAQERMRKESCGERGYLYNFVARQAYRHQGDYHVWGQPRRYLGSDRGNSDSGSVETPASMIWFKEILRGSGKEDEKSDLHMSEPLAKNEDHVADLQGPEPSAKAETQRSGIQRSKPLTKMEDQRPKHKMSGPNTKPRAMLGRITTEHLMYLAPLYTDVTFSDLAATIAHQYKEEYTREDLIENYKIIHGGQIQEDYGKQDRASEPPKNLNYLVMAFTGAQTDKDYNEPIAKLARYRRSYDSAMTELNRSFPGNRNEDIEPLLKPSEDGLNLVKFQDLCPPDLDKIYEAQEKIRKEKCDEKGITSDSIAGQSARH